MSLELVRTLVTGLPGVTEGVHFDKISFKTAKAKIFATLDLKLEQLCVKLNPEDQDTFHKISPENIYPVPNKWGLKGWTFAKCATLGEELLADLLETAYSTVSEGR